MLVKYFIGEMKMVLNKVKSLVKRAKELYPDSIIMQKNWVRQTVDLTDRGRHALQTGGWTYPSYQSRAIL